MKKKKVKKKQPKDPFKELVDLMQKKTSYPETMGRGQVKGNDVARIRDILNEDNDSV
mgnify:FL=1|tara:strand:- start:395 stop:565 length:171 start_codon:yes stop_codon:yes gene_type:complete